MMVNLEIPQQSRELDAFWRERVVTIDRFFVARLTVYVCFVLSTDYWNA